MARSLVLHAVSPPPVEEHEAENREHMGTPEQAQKSMQAWLGWIRELESKGHLKDPGQPLDRAARFDAADP